MSLCFDVQLKIIAHHSPLQCPENPNTTPQISSTLSWVFVKISGLAPSHSSKQEHIHVCWYYLDDVFSFIILFCTQVVAFEGKVCSCCKRLCDTPYIVCFQFDMLATDIPITDLTSLSLLYKLCLAIVSSTVNNGE